MFMTALSYNRTAPSSYIFSRHTMHRLGKGLPLEYYLESSDHLILHFSSSFEVATKPSAGFSLALQFAVQSEIRHQNIN